MTRPIRLPLLLALTALALTAIPVRAQVTWTGGGITDQWSNGLNWNDLIPPTAGADVTIYSSGFWSNTDLDYNLEVNHLYFENSSNFSVLSSENATLTVDSGIYYLGSGNLTIGAAITGSGVLWLDGGTGTVTLTANTAGQNTYSGTTEVYAGATLTDGAPDSFSANSVLYIGGALPGTVNVNYNEIIGGLQDVSGGPGTLNIASTAILDITGSYSNSFSGYITGSGTLLYSSVGTLILEGPSSFTGTLDIANGSTVQIGAGTLGSINAATVEGFGSLTFGRSNANSFSGNIGQGIQVVQNGSGATTLSGTNTYTGSTVVNAGGSLVAGSTSAFGNGASAVVLNNGTLSLGNYSNLVASLSGGASGIVQLGTATLTLTDSEADTTFAGAIHGSGGLTTDQYVLSLTGSGSDYSGETMITGGTLLADNSAGSAVGSGNVHISAGATLQIGNVDANGLIGASSGIYDYGTLTFATTSNLAFNNLVVGTGGVLKYETNTVALGASSYSGPTSVYAGTLTDSNANGLSPNSDFTISSGAALAVAYNDVVGSLQDTINSGGVFIAGGATLSSNGQNYVSDFSGVISGPGTFEVANGVQGLSGNNTYSGGTIISGDGELFVGSNTAIGTGVLEFNGPGTEMSPDANVTLGNNIVLLSTFDNDDGGSNGMTLTGQISGPGEIEWCAPGTLTLTGNNYFSGGVDMREGTLVLLNNTGAGTGPITLDTSTMLVVANGITISNPINVTAAGPAATVAGNGTIASALTVGPNTTIAASDSSSGGPGNLTFSGGLTLANGGGITLRLYDANGAAGTGYSLLSATGGLGITASAGGFAVNVVSIDNAGNSASAINFSPYSSYSWKFATSTSAITGFSPTAFTVNNGLLNATLGGSFSVSECGNSLFVDFTPVPEPATWALMAAGTLAVGAVAARRRRAGAGGGS